MNPGERPRSAPTCASWPACTSCSSGRLAAYIGLSAQGLWNILNGRSEPRTRTVQLCAHAFGVTVDDLLGDTGTCLRAAAAAYE